MNRMHSIVLVAAWLMVSMVLPGMAATYSVEVLADDPVGYFRLEEGSGTAADSGTVNGAQNGTYVGSITQVTGPIPSEASNNGVSFDGSSYVSAADASNLLGSDGDYTVEMWLKPTGGGGQHQAAVSKGKYLGATFCNVQAVASEIQAGINAGAGGTANAPYPTPNVWTYVVTTFEANQPSAGSTRMTTYYNSNPTPVAQATPIALQTTADNTGKPLNIGALLWEGNVILNYYEGDIDEVAVYKSILPTGRMAAHYLASVPGIPYSDAVLADSPQGYWKLDETGSPAAAVDSSGNGKDLTYVAGTVGHPGAGPATRTSAQTLANPSSGIATRSGDTASFDFNSGTAFTLEAWAKISTEVAGVATLVSKYASNDGYFLGILKDGGLTSNKALPILQFGDGTYAYAIVDPQYSDSLADGNWHHIVGVYTGSGSTGGMSLYVDGMRMEVNRATDGFPTSFGNSEEFKIGVRGTATGTAFDGFIDEVAVYGTALSGVEILTHFKAAQITTGTVITIR